MNIMRQTTYLVVNSITVNSFAFSVTARQRGSSLLRKNI